MRTSRVTDPTKLRHYIVRFRAHQTLPAWGPEEKSQLQLILQGTAEAFLVEVIDYAIVGNEAIALVKVPPASARNKLTDGQLLHQMRLMKSDQVARNTAAGLVRSKPPVKAKYRKNLEAVRQCCCDLSAFGKGVGLRFASWHQMKHKRKPVWRDRFKSEMLPDNGIGSLETASSQISETLRNAKVSLSSYPWCSAVNPIAFRIGPPRDLPKYVATTEPAKKSQSPRRQSKRAAQSGQKERMPKSFAEAAPAPPRKPIQLTHKQAALLRKTITTKNPRDFGLESGGFNYPWNVQNVYDLCSQLFGERPTKVSLRETLIEWKVMQSRSRSDAKLKAP